MHKPSIWQILTVNLFTIRGILKYSIAHLHVASFDRFEGLVGRVDGARPQLEGGVVEGAHPALTCMIG